MATMEIVKGHCGKSKCNYDVYTKEKIDELLKDKVNTAVITEINKAIETINDNATLKQEVKNITLNYQIKQNFQEVKTGTITVPITFFKNGSIAQLDEIEVKAQLTGLTDPVVSTNSKGKPLITFGLTSGSLPYSINITYESKDVFKKYNPMGNKQIFEHNEYATIDYNGEAVQTDTTKLRATINLTADKIVINFNGEEAGSIALGNTLYMADNID